MNRNKIKILQVRRLLENKMWYEEIWKTVCYVWTCPQRFLSELEIQFGNDNTIFKVLVFIVIRIYVHKGPLSLSKFSLSKKKL